MINIPSSNYMPKLKSICYSVESYCALQSSNQMWGFLSLIPSVLILDCTGGIYHPLSGDGIYKRIMFLVFRYFLLRETPLAVLGITLYVTWGISRLKWRYNWVESLIKVGVTSTSSIIFPLCFVTKQIKERTYFTI